jgi:hypothetical protein
MVDLIEFPTNKVAPDSLPDAGDKYEAFGLSQKFKPAMLTFVFPDGAMTSLAYDGLGMMNLRPLDDNPDGRGECMVSLSFGRKAADAAIVVITGRNLYDLFADLGYHRVHWIWEMPKGRAVAADGAPVVHSIEIKEATPQNRVAFLS